MVPLENPEKIKIFSCRHSVIKIQNPTQGTRAFDLVPRVCQARVRIHETVIDSLMRSSVVVKIAVDADRMPQATITNKPEAMQAFSLERAEEALDVRIAVGCPRRDPHDLDSGGTQHVIESGFAEFTATIVDQVGGALRARDPPAVVCFRHARNPLPAAHRRADHRQPDGWPGASVVGRCGRDQTGRLSSLPTYLRHRPA